MGKTNLKNQHVNDRLIEEAAERLAKILIAQVEFGSSPHDDDEDEEGIYPSDLAENDDAGRPIVLRKISLKIKP